jgi:di/tricarboxylate transporter
MFTKGSGVAEIMIPPRSTLIGRGAFPGMTTESGELVVLALQRAGEDLGPGESALKAGDALLLQGTWDALSSNIENDPNVRVVDPPQLVRRQAVRMGPGSGRALTVLGAMVVLLASGAVPTAVAAMLGAIAMVLLRVLSSEQAYRAISWTTVILIAGMIPVATAIKESGAADKTASTLVEAVGSAGPHVLLIGLFIITAVFGQLISNTATALIVIPIAVAAAGELHISTRPVLMSVAVAAAASFLTPVATPANMIVMGPGGYRFGDYWRLGLPVMVLFVLVAVFLVPIIWAF